MSNLSERKQSLLDFVNNYQYRPETRQTNQYDVDNLGYDPDDVTEFHWPSYSTPFAAGTYQEETDRRHLPYDFYSARINKVPAEYVGGNKGEYRYYGGGYKYLMNQRSRQMAAQRANKAPFTHVGDSIPTSEAMYLKNLWENK